MAANPQRLYMTEEQYLAFDRARDTKYEYLDGEAVAMSGGSVNHSRLAGNLFFLLAQALGTRGPCIPYNSDIRVLVANGNMFTPISRSPVMRMITRVSTIPFFLLG